MLYSWTDFIDKNSSYICKDESLMSYRHSFNAKVSGTERLSMGKAQNINV